MLAYVFLYITVRKFIQCIFNLMEEEAEDGPQWANHSSTLYLWGLFAPSPFFLSFGHPHSVNTTILLPNNLTQFSHAFPPSHHYFPALYLRLFTVTHHLFPLARFLRLLCYMLSCGCTETALYPLSSVTPISMASAHLHSDVLGL